MDHMAFPSQFLWELHFIEAAQPTGSRSWLTGLQFFRELHFIAAIRHTKHLRNLHLSQFFRELHFIEAETIPSHSSSCQCRSSFGSCTSLRPVSSGLSWVHCPKLQFLRELHFNEVGGD